jgi:hypothetical protein
VIDPNGTGQKAEDQQPHSQESEGIPENDVIFQLIGEKVLLLGIPDVERGFKGVTGKDSGWQVVAPDRERAGEKIGAKKFVLDWVRNADGYKSQKDEVFLVADCLQTIVDRSPMGEDFIDGVPADQVSDG